MPILYSTDRILVTHAGALPRPADVRPMVLAKSRGETIDQAALDAKLKTAVADVVKQQIKSGIDSVNDGELSKSNFTDYVRTRLTGFENRTAEERRRLEITARDRLKFPDYFEATSNPRARLSSSGPQMRPVVIEKLRYI